MGKQFPIMATRPPYLEGGPALLPVPRESKVEGAPGRGDSKIK